VKLYGLKYGQTEIVKLKLNVTTFKQLSQKVPKLKLIPDLKGVYPTSTYIKVALTRYN
jgi:hypothetical protein